MAINRFKDEMYKQYFNDFGWYGSYRKIFGQKYIDIVDKFLAKISCEGEVKSLAHTIRIGFSLGKAIKQFGARILLGRRFDRYGRTYVSDNKTQRFLLVNEQQFIQYARKFIKEYFDMCAEEDNLMIYDHLILPKQTAVVEKFFDNDFRLIIVDRDPRDVFFSDKYILDTAKFRYAKIPGPRTVEGFCTHWNAMHEKASRYLSNEKVLVIKFEDIIYNYSSTLNKLCEFCEISRNAHIDAGKYFSAEISQKNTQIFKVIQDIETQKYIENTLPDLLYDFPYQSCASRKEIF